MIKTKIIALTIAIFIFAIAGFGIYLFRTENKMKISNNLEKLENMEAIELDEENIESIQSYTQFSDNLILIKGGTFTMGSPNNERQRNRDETQHTVTINSFYIDPYEVTQKDYREIMGNNPSYFSGDNLPVENITWFDAVNYCNKLSEKRGLTPVYSIEGNTVRWNRTANGYRLLTEAEWEYAARGGNKSRGYKYSGSNNPDAVAWYDVNSGNKTHPVAQKQSNELGLYDMSGNVYEWCQDWYGDYSSNSQTNPIGASNGGFRVLRGGSYFMDRSGVRVSFRSRYMPDCGHFNDGVRLAL